MKKRIGTHVIFDCHGCQTDFSKLKPKQIQQDIIQLVRQKWLIDVGDMIHEFPEPGAFTTVILLAESHVTIHTWPEERYVSIDIFVCNMSRDFSKDAEEIGNSIVHIFSPENLEKTILSR